MDNHLLSDCPELLKEFLFYMETIKGRSPKTVEAYYVDLRLFLRYIKKTKVLDPNTEMALSEIPIADLSPETICSVTLSDVYAFLNFVLTDRENGSNARSRKVSSIRSFYNYITKKTQYLEVSPVKDLEVPSIRKTVPKYLTLEESLELLHSIDTEKNPRDFCMITLMLNCGMRVSELVGINLEDIRKVQDGDSIAWTLKLLGKGNKERVIYLNSACVDAIDLWMKSRPSTSDVKNQNALFLSRRGTRLTTRRVEQILEGYLKEAGLSGRGFSPHKLRHTAATLMYQNGGVDVRILKEILGHVSLSTTEIYTHVSNNQLQKAADHSPLANVKSKPRKKPVPLPPFPEELQEAVPEHAEDSGWEPMDEDHKENSFQSGAESQSDDIEKESDAVGDHRS